MIIGITVLVITWIWLIYELCRAPNEEEE